jgi:hypothetical protein
MKRVLPLFVFIDACGWEIIKDQPFAKSFAPHRRRLTSVFGYSSACVPSILSGAWPSEHHNWCYFVYDPAHSPFKSLKPLRFLPRAVTGRRRVRRLLSKVAKSFLKFEGYFDLYNIPFPYIDLFDFSEKKSPLKPRGMNRGTNIFDFLEGGGIHYHVSDPARAETENLAAIREDVQREAIDFAFVYLPDLDGLLHMVGNDSPRIPQKLNGYQEQIADLLAVAQQHYEDVHLYIFSDHGMANCTRLIDLRSRIESLPVKMSEDYMVVYDSTMARFWFFNEQARKLITDALALVPEGRVLPDKELMELGTFFPDRHFGELIFLVREGTLIVPSFMGERPIHAMHGYHPSEPQSYAALLTNQTQLPAEATDIPHICRLMKAEATRAFSENRTGSVSASSRIPVQSQPAYAM